jgi:hypothetical protein
VLSPGLVIVCAISAVLGYLCRRFRSWVYGFCVALIGPIVIAYAVAWSLMSPLLHPSAEEPGPWILIGTAIWATWGVPICVVSWVLFRWRTGRKPNAL